MDVVSALNVSVSRRSRDVFGTSRSHLGLEDTTSRSRVSGFVTLGLVNIHAMHEACGYISKKTRSFAIANRTVRRPCLVDLRGVYTMIHVRRTCAPHMYAVHVR